MSDKQEERDHLRAFLDRMENLPEGKLSFAGKNEAPDLRIESEDGPIGVEHQRLFYPRSNNGIIRQEQESLRNDIVSQAKREFLKEADVALNVTIYFHTLYGLAVDPKDVKLTSDKVQPRAKQIARLVQENIPGIGNSVHLRPKMNDDSLPGGILSIWIDRPKNKAYALWTSPEGGAVARFTPGFIKKHIAKKEKKLDRYSRGCSEVWLLLVADGGRFSTWFDRETSDEAFENRYSTGFDRVFVLSGPELKLEELHTESQAT